MSVTIVVDTSFGDCGKGRLVDYLAKDFNIVARFNGGNNCGHVVIVNGSKYTMNFIPSGILHPGKVCVIGNGTVLNLSSLKEEIRKLNSLGVETKGRLFISKNAHVITDVHLKTDQEKNTHLKTTGKGIGPSYEDKIGRRGIRVGDIYDVELQPYITDTSYLINDYLDKGAKILCEAGQGTLLDIDHGTYPYVTSSTTTAAGACTGLGFGPTHVKNVIGILKTYMTRVGEGPFPTELFDETGEKLRILGKEYGSVTGRPRRCGWLDLPMLKYACMINGCTELAITKLDILDTFETIQVCTEYEWDGMNIANPTLDQMLEGRPVYKTYPGWMKDTTKVRTWSELPKEAREYINSIEVATRVFAKYVSTGADRNSIIVC